MEKGGILGYYGSKSSPGKKESIIKYLKFNHKAPT
jgi:hypothetical protein